MKKSEGQDLKFLVSDVLRVLVAVVVSIALIFVSNAVWNHFKPVEPDETVTGAAQGLLSEVTVSIDLKDGVILNAEANADGETPELGGAAIASYNAGYLAELKGKTLADIDPNAIDTVAGSTVSSNAFIAALKQAAGIEDPVEEVVEEVAEAAPAAEGDQLIGTANGMGEVTVTFTVADGIITAASAEGANETPGLGADLIANANEGYFADLVGTAVADVDPASFDVVSGCTVTSNAIIEAMTQIVGAPAEEGTTAAEEAPAEETAAAPAAEGEQLVGTANGMGEVTVTFTVADGIITAASAEGANETPGLGADLIANANEGYFADLVGTAVADVDPASFDVVSGCTVTSNAIIEAMTQIVGAPAEEGTAAAEETPAEETAAAPADAVALADAADGTYTATAKGFGGDVTTAITIAGGAITDVQITGENETPALGGVAVEKMPAQIVAAQAIDVEGVSGATVTSTAVKESAKAALAQAGVDADSLVSIASAEDVVKTEETIDVDVVVVGAGGAGMAAAITAKQADKNVIILEKMPYVGGNTTKASGGMNAAGTKKQAEALAAATDEKVKESLEGSTVENFIADTMAGGHDLNNPDLVRTMAENSSDAIDWLESIGAPLPTIAATGGTVHMYLHEPEDGSAVGDYLVTAFSAQLDAMGIPVMLETKATELISDNGVVVGVKAESADKLLTINAKAVILATGGFGANEEMYCTYRPDLKGTVTTNAPGATGDGIVMAQAMDADLVDIDQIQLHPTVFQENGFLVSERLRSNGAILINLNGQRFTNDLATRDAVSAAELEQPECCAFIVYDSQYAEEKLYQKYVTNGLTTEGATLEELAANIGLDAAATENFVATVAAWNETVNNGTEDEFGRNNGLVALEKAPFYAIKIAPGIHHCMGGIKIDTDTHVINTSGEVIPGLYAAGEVTGGVHGGNRIGGNAVADIVVYGRIAGTNACAFADGDEAPAAEETAEEAPAEETAAAAETLTGSATGMDTVTVTLTVENGVITAASAEGANETPALGGKVIEDANANFLAGLVGMAPADVDPSAFDAVSGSTLTSNAIIDALTQAIGK